jgi:hypothetical protein
MRGGPIRQAVNAPASRRLVNDLQTQRHRHRPDEALPIFADRWRRVARSGASGARPRYAGSLIKDRYTTRRTPGFFPLQRTSHEISSASASSAATPCHTRSGARS